MTEMEKQMQDLLTEATNREQKTRRMAFYLTIIPAALALLLLMGTGLQMRSANQAVSVAKDDLDKTEQELLTVNLELDNTYDALEDANQGVLEVKKTLTETMVTLEIVTADLVSTRGELAQTEVDMRVLQEQYDGLQEKVSIYNQEIEDLNAQIEELMKSLDSVREELRAATDLKRYRFSGDWAVTVKYIATELPSAGALLQTIIELENSPWHTGGFAPNTGFDSPSFAAFVLEVNKRISLNNPSDRYDLIALLPLRQGNPQIGDIVFYEGGYTMFYFVDVQGNPFVIGMTTQGVLALAPDFAQIKSYGVTEPQ